MFDTILNRGAEPVRWLIVGCIAYTLATTIWTFFQSPMDVATAPAGSDTIETPDHAPANVNWILSKNLFGEAGAQPQVAEQDDDAPVRETRLPLELQSVLVASDTEQSTAIVAQRGKPGVVYHIGENLPGNAELVDVLADRIILRRAGVRETLMFPKSSVGFEEVLPANTNSASPRAVPVEPQPNPAQTAQATAEDYQQRLQEDAPGTLDELGIESVDGGGYRVSDLSQSPYLQRTGLQPGDVILSVNGKPVGDVQSDQLELASIMAAGSARIEVQRGARRFFITASLK